MILAVTPITGLQGVPSTCRGARDWLKRHGIPDKILTDNGGAINSRKITGGLRPRYRTVQQRASDWDVPGVMAIYGIELQNTAPGAPRGKLPESIYSALRHIDNAPEFHRAQRSGPIDSPNPNPDVIGFEIFEAVLRNRIDECKTMPSRAQQTRGGSREDAFERLSADRVWRHVSPLQRRSVRMTWHKRMVMPDGRVKFAGGLFGDATTQEAMLAHEGKYVLVGIDPTDYSAPAMVRGWEEAHLRGRVLVNMLPAYEACSVTSDEGRRRAVGGALRRSAGTGRVMTGLALATCDLALPPGRAPEWVHIFPGGPSSKDWQVKGRDGRAWDLIGPSALSIKGVLNTPSTVLSAVAEHRRLHRSGQPSRIASDPDLQAFIRARIDTMTFTDIIVAIAAAFPKERRTSMSALSRWWATERNGQSANHSRCLSPSPPPPDGS